MTNRSFPAIRADDAFINRRNLSLGFIPLLVPFALCLLSLTQRLLLEPEPGAHMSPVQASLTAGELCEQITESDAQAGKATFSHGFSRSRHKHIGQWDVVCDTPQGQYLFPHQRRQPSGFRHQSAGNGEISVCGGNPPFAHRSGSLQPSLPEPAGHQPG